MTTSQFGAIILTSSGDSTSMFVDGLPLYPAFTVTWLMTRRTPDIPLTAAVAAPI